MKSEQTVKELIEQRQRLAAEAARISTLITTLDQEIQVHLQSLAPLQKQSQPQTKPER